jgi:hypothetical protein
MDQQSRKPPFGPSKGDRSNVPSSLEGASGRGSFSAEKRANKPSGGGRVDDGVGNVDPKRSTGSPASSPDSFPKAAPAGAASLLNEAHDAAGVAVDAAHSASGAVQNAATEITEVAKAAAQATIRAVSAQASELASNVTGELSATAEMEKDRGAAAMRGFAKAIRTAAGELDGQSPEIARHFRGAAASVESFSDNLRSRSIGDLFGAATDLARNQPAAFFAGAVVTGFALSRFLKSTGRPAPSTQEGTTESSPTAVGQSPGVAPSAPSSFTL